MKSTPGLWIVCAGLWAALTILLVGEEMERRAERALRADFDQRDFSQRR